MTTRIYHRSTIFIPIQTKLVRTILCNISITTNVNGHNALSMNTEPAILCLPTPTSCRTSVVKRPSLRLKPATRTFLPLFVFWYVCVRINAEVVTVDFIALVYFLSVAYLGDEQKSLSTCVKPWTSVKVILIAHLWGVLSSARAAPCLHQFLRKRMMVSGITIHLAVMLALAARH